MSLIVKSNIKKAVKELQGKNGPKRVSSGEEVSSVAEEVETALEKKVEEILISAIERAKANKRRTLQARDL